MSSQPSDAVSNWKIFTGDLQPHNGISRLPDPPRWRSFSGELPARPRDLIMDSDVERRLGVSDKERRPRFRPTPETVKLVNAALYLRRPLLVTGKPGTGKSTLAHAVAYELGLGRVLSWAITSRSVLQDGLFRYDALSHLQAANIAGSNATHDLIPSVGDFIRLGPVGTAFLPAEKPRVLLVDEIDKSDIDLPNDLLNVFEEGEFEIPELARLAHGDSGQSDISVLPADGNDSVVIREGRVRCRAFPFVVITSNGERELPSPFKRRCLQLEIRPPGETQIEEIVAAHFGIAERDQYSTLIRDFLRRRDKQGDSGFLATDQLLNAVYLAGNTGSDWEQLVNDVLKKI